MGAAFTTAALCFCYAWAQSLELHTRLSTVPIDPGTLATITGHGSAEATLDGRRLIVSGAFEGLQGPASTARLHLSAATGIRGPAIYDLEVTHAAKGDVSASLQLSAEHAEALRDGRIYIQIDTENTPEGNLWGWLLP
jgi:CHRD domain